ncbi:hypothetical protein NDU88_003206 [Pleurodeles waltl]|uniref:Uncharacterized protein n=1 Tax=Pleurodeles waltl TaxID=8319 RepID=A0AAV7WNE5_PLEWA|nr:hypothetical protein NDU88_003206 [Pleurodeles waltl]
MEGATGADLSLADLLMANQNSCNEMVRKIDSIAIDANLLRTDLRKVADRVTTVEQYVDSLQKKVFSLHDTVLNLQKVATA